MMRFARNITLGTIIFGLVLALIVFVITAQSPNTHATVTMGLVAYLLWVVIGGTMQWQLRDVIRSIIRSVPLPWMVTFVLFATGLMMIEEAITTLMTNLAPMFGSQVGKAYMTASANYWDVVFFHSVIVTIPIFIAWAILLRRYAFTPLQAFWLFGLTGVIMEMVFSGPQQLLQLPFWIPIYGMMIWLPVYCVPEREAKPVRPWHYALPFLAAVIALAAFYLIMTIIGIVTGFQPFTNHPMIHFPPITE